MAMDTSTLKRYTNLASLISILKNKELVLLDPMKWEDKNDSHYLVKYGERKGFKSLYALCFTTTDETSHHWKAFCPGADGVCIKIRKEPFVAHLNTLDGVMHGQVVYKLIDEVVTENLRIDQLPFLKRYPFRDEAEYRILYRATAPSKSKAHAISFDLSFIQEITLSNSLPNDLRNPLVELLRSIDGCAKIKISRSTLNDNLRWKNACDRAT
jgi:hypothetical protein